MADEKSRKESYGVYEEAPLSLTTTENEAMEINDHATFLRAKRRRKNQIVGYEKYHGEQNSGHMDMPPLTVKSK